jgi:hypothetical protein
LGEIVRKARNTDAKHLHRFDLGGDIMGKCDLTWLKKNWD